MEQRSGPLLGTLLLGVLWGLWHLPLFFIPGTDQYAISVVGTGFVGHLVPFGVFVIWTIALAMLLHASINTAPFVLLPTLFPSSTVSMLFGLSWILVWIMVALLVIAATRGRLSYQRYLRETALPAPVTDREQAKDPASGVS